MSYSNYPNGFSGGVTIRGIPISVTHPGEVFWVNSTTVLPVGSKSPNGGAPGTFLEAVTTISEALDLCTASRGDIIMVMPGYTETIPTADVPWDVAGVAIIGLGLGGNKPVLTWGATGAVINVTADNVSVFNIRFVVADANTVDGLVVTGEEFHIDSCEFMSEAAADAFDMSIRSTTAAIGLSITNCTFNSESSVAGVAVTDVPGHGIRTLSDNSYIDGNNFLGNYSVTAIHNVSTAILGGVIINNDIYNNSTTATAGGISVASGSTGLIMRNMLTVLETSSVDGLIINPAMAMSENYAVNVLLEAGGVVGTPSGN